MKIFTMTCGANILLDDEDYERLPKTGWYLLPSYLHNSTTDYAQHDTFGRLHRWVLNVTDPSLTVDHLDRNGLNNQKENLRVVSCSINKRNQEVVKSNKFNFNGISYEENGNRKRFRVRWSTFENDPRYNRKAKMQKSKSFSLSLYSSPQEALKDAVLFRIQRMKEFDYIIDERSTTIENLLLNDPNTDIEGLLGIDLMAIISRVVPSGTKKD